MMSSLDRLIASSRKQPFVWANEHYKPHNQTFQANLHTVAEGLPFIPQSKQVGVRYQEKIPGANPIGDNEKTRRERRIDLMNNNVILKANQSSTKTNKSNK